MNGQELSDILRLHGKWQRNEPDGKRANFFGKNLTGAYLCEADLTGASLDHASWPLWGGSLHTKIDRRIFCQLAYHLCAVTVDDEECKVAQTQLGKLANEFHRVRDGQCKPVKVDTGRKKAARE